MQLQTVKLSNLRAAPWRISDERPCQETKNVVRSLKKYGQLRPIIVRHLGAEDYQIIDGHVVVDAGREAGLEELSCVVQQLKDEDAALLYLHLKLNRTVRNQIKIREAFKFVGDLEKISQAICWPKERVSDYLKLAEL
jgi:ParB family transcriptional regulator, chromosome partitioning protein